MATRTLLRSLPRSFLMFVSVVVVLLVVDDAWPDSDAFDKDLIALLLSFAIGITALVFVAGRDRLRRVIPKLAAALTVVLLSTAAALAAAELGTRWVYRDVTSTADNRGFFARRWSESGLLSVNGRGFREREFAAAPAPGIYRIAVVGDSFTFGNGIRTDQRFSNLIQASLGSGFEVLNLGVAGHNTPQHLDLVQREVLALHPRFVLLQWYVNDVESEVVPRPTYTPLLPFAGLHKRLDDDSAFYTLANSWWTRLQIRMQSEQSYSDYLKAAFSNPQSEAARADEGATRTLLRTLRAARIGVGVVLFPDTGYDLGPSYPFEFLHARVLAICEDEHVHAIDMRPVFASVKRRRALWANPLDAHPSALANSIAAEQILEAFEREWLTARGEPRHAF